MVRIEGTVSRRVIRAWLDNYQALEAQDVEVDAIPTNAGAKSYDGISSKQLNKVMLDDAINNLPPRIKLCVYARWIKRLGLGEALNKLGVSRAVYYIRCDQAVELIYWQMNGLAANYRNLVEEIKKGLTFPRKKA